jgi:GNAT superfamily N-acetyltransferase
VSQLDTDPRARGFRDAYDAQIRTRVLVRDSAVERVDKKGPITRKTSLEGRGFITYTDLDGMDGEKLDAFIAEQREHFAAVGQSVEWKYHGYDLPEDLPDRLRAAGFVPEDPETIVIGEAADLAVAPRVPEGVELREITEPRDLDRIRVMEERVWGEPHDWLPAALAAELVSKTDPIVVLAAEADGEVVSAAWIRFHKGTEFASLWGGSTLAEWRGRGVYRALVARRAQLALRRGYRYLQADCSPDSAPILRRLGMSWVATTVPYVWAPSS